MRVRKKETSVKAVLVYLVSAIMSLSFIYYVAVIA